MDNNKNIFDFKNFGTPLWDFNNPLAEKVINGVLFKITDECKVFNRGTPQAYKLLTLYQGYVCIGDFRCIDDAKACAEGLAKIMYN